MTTDVAQATPSKLHGFEINTAPSDGFMFRGGFPVSSQANMNYAAYVSTTSIGIGSVDSERHAGGRIGLFLPGPRLEIGGSRQKR